MRGRIATCAVAVLLGAGGAACNPVDGPDSDSSTRQLEQQRDDVRRTARDLVTAVAADLEGRLSSESGFYRGCESSGPETFGSFRYSFRGRVDAGAFLAPRPFLDHLDDVVEDVGFRDLSRGERPGGITLSASLDGIEMTISEFTVDGDYVVVDMEGPCVETPDEDSDGWLRENDDASVLD